MTEDNIIEIVFIRLPDTGLPRLDDVLYESVPEYTITFSLSREEDQKLANAIQTYEKENEPSESKEKQLILSIIPDLKDRIAKFLEQEQNNFANEIRKNYDKINIRMALGRDDSSDNWFETTVIDVIDLGYINSDEIDADDLLADLSEYIYPDPTDFEDPEEYEERLEQLERYSERDQHELITYKGAQATVRRLLNERKEIIEAINSFLEHPTIRLSENEIMGSILEEAHYL